jgi:hypothetical protein
LGNTSKDIFICFNSNGGSDDRALEEEAEKKFGWILKIFFLGTAGLVGYQFFPYMGTGSSSTGVWIISIAYFSGEPELVALPDKFSGDNLLLQSISLLRVKDPLFKRMGASRLTRFAVDGN